MTIGEARAKGAVSIVNAIACGKGATVAVDLPTSARVYVRERRGGWRTFENGREHHSRLARDTVCRAIRMLGKSPRDYSGSVETNSSTPVGVGLKTSSSASVAIALAVCDAFGERSPPGSKILECSVLSSLSSGVSVTGAMDDAASCLFGGANFVDNSAGKIVSKVSVGGPLHVVISVPHQPSRRRRTPVRDVRRFSRYAGSIFEMGVMGKAWKAMTLNGLMCASIYGYDPSPALQAVEGGALGAGLSGTGPAVAAVFEGRSQARKLAEAWAGEDVLVLTTTTSDGGAAVGA